MQSRAEALAASLPTVGMSAASLSCGPRTQFQVYRLLPEGPEVMVPLVLGGKNSFKGQV